MNCEDFATHLVDCLEEGRDPASVHEGREHLERCPNCRRDAAELAVLWQRLPLADPVGSNSETPSIRLRERFEESLGAVLEAQKLSTGAVGDSKEEGGRVVVGPWKSNAWTALAATLALGLALGFFFGGRFSTRSEIRALRSEMHSVNETVAVALMKHDSASERLRGIALSGENLSGPAAGGGRVIDALFERVRSDPNDNVRLAAVETLAEAVDRTEVRDGLAACIAFQESPHVQAAVLEALAGSDQGTLDEALSSDELNDDVRSWILAMTPTFVG